MEWYEYYGWKENPFVPKSNADVIGLHFTKKRVLEYINNGDICFLNGPAGAGKSSLMKWTHKNLAGYIPVLLSAEEIKEDTEIENLLQRSTWQKLTKKEFVLLLDESQESSTAFQKAMKLNWDKNKIKSIVIAQIEDLDNFPENFQHRVGNRLIKLNRLTKSNVVDMLNDRADGKNPLAVEAMEEIGKEANYNPRKVLELAERVCMDMAAMQKDTINLYDVKHTFSSGAETVQEIEKPAIEIKEQVVDDIKEEAPKILEKPEITKPETPKVKPPESPIPEFPRLELNQPGVEPAQFEKTPIVKPKKKLSPLERKIVRQLKDGEKTVKDLSELLTSSEGSIGKQLSKLTIKNKVEIKDHKRPKRYGLIQNE